MNYVVYAFRDKKIGYMQPFFQLTDPQAMRSAKLAVEDPDSTLCKIKDDLELWRLGTYDDQLGKLTPELKFIMPMVDTGEVSS